MLTPSSVSGRVPPGLEGPQQALCWGMWGASLGDRVGGLGITLARWSCLWVLSGGIPSRTEVTQ